MTRSRTPYRIIRHFLILAISLVIACNSFAQEEVTAKHDRIIDLKKEEEILKALDDLNKQLDLIEIDKNHQLLLKDKLDGVEKSLKLIEKDHQVPLLEDSLNDLDIDQALSEEFDLIDEWPFDEFEPHLKSKGLKESKTNGPKSQNLGKEEFIIHQLDKSELKNIDKELELLKRKADLKPPPIEKELYEY